MWRRRPPWMYLPSQTFHFDDVDAKASSAANVAFHDKEGSGEPAESVLVAHPKPALAAHPLARGGGVRDSSASAAAGPTRDVMEPNVEAARHGDRHTGAGDQIRGHQSMPGALHVESALGLRAGAAFNSEQIRGPPAGPGAIVSARVSREQQRLDKLNAGLARSFADHAERVARKRERAGGGERPATAAERIAAIRRRLSARSVAPAAGEGGVGAGSTSVSSSVQAGGIGLPSEDFGGG
jgi:hypothetical protein